MNKKYLIILIGLLVLVTILSFLILIKKYDTFEHKMVTWINNNCKDLKSGSCIIKISDLTDFEWDRMYVTVDGNILRPPKDMIKLLYDEDILNRKIFFQSKGNLIFLQKMSTNIENTVKNGIYFDIPDNQDYGEYTPELAIFVVKKTEDKYPHFELTQLTPYSKPAGEAVVQ